MSEASELDRDRPDIAGIELGSLLGEGAVARVYAGRDDSGREVAVKIAKRSRADDGKAHARALREARVLSRLDHPGIVRVYDAGETEHGHAYLVLEKLEGARLVDRIAEGPMKPAEAWRVVRAAALALAHAHAAGVLHRDLTPANVMLDGRGHVRLTDFGLAKTEGDPQLTKDGEATGTPAYMAPEQWWGAELDERTDVYGLGALLFSTLAGRAPWAGEDPGELLHKLATAEPQRLRDAGIAVSEDADAFVARCLRREAGGRPPDVTTFIAEGDRAFGHRGHAGIGRWLAALAVVFVAAAVGYGGTHDPREWILKAGLAGYALPFVAALSVLALRFRRMLPVAPLLPLMLGGIGMAAGFGATMGGIYGAPAEERFVIFHLGVEESMANLFLGAVLSCSIALAVAWDGLPKHRADARAAVGIALASAAAVFTLDLAVVAVAAVAVTLLLRMAPARGIAGVSASLAAVGAAAIAAMATTLGDGARLWSFDLTRAERAAALAEASDHRTAVFAALIAIVAALLLSARPRRGTRPSGRAVVGGAAFAALTVATMALPAVAVLGERDLLWEELSVRFALWRDLDPPSGQTGSSARVGPTLQLGRTSVAVDGETVVPREALETGAPTATLLVAEKLGPRLRLGSSSGPALVLAADRTLPYAVVDRALDAARDLGVRRIDILVAPGEPVRLRPGTSPEAAFVLPRDLSAIDVELAPRSADVVRPDPQTPFEEVVQDLLTRDSPVL